MQLGRNSRLAISRQFADILQARRRQLLKRRMQLQLDDQGRMELHKVFFKVIELVNVKSAVTMSKEAAKRLKLTDLPTKLLRRCPV